MDEKEIMIPVERIKQSIVLIPRSESYVGC
jgi:hypothetical protein